MITFETAFDTLARKSGLPVFVEGCPIIDTLTEKETVARIKREFKATPLDAAFFHALAQAFDYEAEVTRTALFLRKRFSQPNDLPDTSFAECASLLEKIENFVRPCYPPPLDPREVMAQLFAAFSNEQAAKLGEGYVEESGLTGLSSLTVHSTGLPVRLFSDAQKNLLRHIVQNTDQQTTNRCGEGLEFLRKVERPDTTLGWYTLQIPGQTHTIEGQSRVFAGRTFTLYGFEFPRSNGFPPVHYPLDRNVRPDFSGSFGFGSDEQKQKAEGVPAAFDANTIKRTQNENAAVTTIADFLSRLDSRGDSYEVEEWYAAKPFCVFGNADIKAEGQFRAVAHLFGLEIVTPRAGILRLTGKSGPAPERIGELPAAIAGALPDSLVRYLAGRKAALRVDINDPSLTRMERFRLQGSERRITGRIAEEMRKTLTDRLLTWLAPEQQSADVKRPISQLDTDEKDTIARLCLSQCLVAIEKMTQPLPGYITHFENAIVHARLGEQHGMPRYFLDISTTEPDSGLGFATPRL